MNDPYLWPGTDCLANKLGITNPEELAAVEHRVAGARYSQLADRPLPGGWDAEHLCRFHKTLFGDVYSWAGRLRTVNIHKGGFPFCYAAFLADHLTELFARLADDRFLVGLTAEAFGEQFARLYGDLNTLHPFREGNGRTQRAFLRQLAAAARWRVEWERLDRTDNDEACRDYCFNADPKVLVDLLKPILSPLS